MSIDVVALVGNPVIQVLIGIIVLYIVFKGKS